MAPTTIPASQLLLVTRGPIRGEKPCQPPVASAQTRLEDVILISSEDESDAETDDGSIGTVSLPSIREIVASVAATRQNRTDTGK